jgi:hypothetical protein
MRSVWIDYVLFHIDEPIKNNQDRPVPIAHPNFNFALRAATRKDALPVRRSHHSLIGLVRLALAGVEQPSARGGLFSITMEQLNVPK